MSKIELAKLDKVKVVVVDLGDTGESELEERVDLDYIAYKKQKEERLKQFENAEIVDLFELVSTNMFNLSRFDFDKKTYVFLLAWGFADGSSDQQFLTYVFRKITESGDIQVGYTKAKEEAYIVHTEEEYKDLICRLKNDGFIVKKRRKKGDRK